MAEGGPLEEKTGGVEAPKPGPWSDLSAEPPRREPLSRAPWPPMVIAGLLIGVYAWQVFSGDAAACAAGDPAAGCARFAFTPAELDQGRWFGLLTALFMHGSWGHVLFNSVFAVAFGAPVARLFGLGFKGAAAFFLFFLLCGVVGNLGFASVQTHAGVSVIGASGAVAGFMGAASRLIDRRGPVNAWDGLAPYTSRTVVSMAAAWVTVNIIVGVLGVDIGFGAGGQHVAWEAHLFGYAAGLAFIGPVSRLVRNRP